MHDIGKTQISEEMLTKEDRLTAEESDILNDHPIYGFTIAEKIEGLTKETARGILTIMKNMMVQALP